MTSLAGEMKDKRTRPGDTACSLKASNVLCHSVCIFDDMWDQLDIGLVILDLVEAQVVRCTRTAADLFRDLAIPVSYESIHQGLVHDIESARPNGSRIAESLRRGSRVVGYSVYPADRRYLVLILRDVTERERLESIAAAVNLMDDIGYVFSGIRHELGNPINSVMIAAKVLRRSIDSFSKDTIAEYLDRILSELSRVEYLLGSLRSFSAFEEVHCVPLKLRSFLDRFATIVAKELVERNVELAIRVADAAEWIIADERALQHVFLNLFTNALDALAGRAQPRITVGATVEGSLAIITVGDNGPGMSASAQAELFKPFFTTKSKGTGLGLVIARKLVTAMSGQIEASSEEGKGTVVTMTLLRGTRPPELDEKKETCS